MTSYDELLIFCFSIPFRLIRYLIRTNAILYLEPGVNKPLGGREDEVEVLPQSLEPNLLDPVELVRTAMQINIGQVNPSKLSYR